MTQVNHFGGRSKGVKHDLQQRSKIEARMIGCSTKVIPADCRQAIEATSGKYSARELTQCFTSDDGEKYQLPLPAACFKIAAGEINVYSEEWEHVAKTTPRTKRGRREKHALGKESSW